MLVIRFKRKPTIIIYQLYDFFSKRQKIILRSWIPREYQTIRNKYSDLVPIKRRKKSKTISIKILKQINELKKFKSITLFDFVVNKHKYNILDNTPENIFRNPRYFSMKRHLCSTRFEDNAEGIISRKEWTILHAYSAFEGFFDNLFEFNDFSLIDQFEKELIKNNVNLRGIYLHDFFVWEILRIAHGFNSYSEFERFLNHFQYFTNFNYLKDILYNPHYRPTAKDISYIWKKIPESLISKLFLTKVKECINLKIIDTRTLIWDAQFVRSNCNNNKNPQTKRYNDPDAGFCRHLNQRKGVGYEFSCLCAHMGSYWLPVYYKIFPGNVNDSKIFLETLKDFCSLKLDFGGLIIADTGAYSERNLKYCLKVSRIPLIRARKNIKKHPLISPKKGFYFNQTYLPKHWNLKDIRRLYERRPQIEAYFSSFNLFYNNKRMSTRGHSSIYKQRGLILIIDLCRAIAAYKLNRHDLIMKKRAFLMPRQILQPSYSIQIALNSNYALLVNPPSRRPIKRRFHLSK